MPVGRTLARVLVGATGAHIGLRLAARTSGWVGPFRVRAALGWAPSGGVHLELAPLGTADLATHRGPLQLRAAAIEIDPARAAGLLDAPDGAPAGGSGDEPGGFDLETLLAAAGADARTLARALAKRSAGAAIGGAAALGALTLRHPRDIAGTLVTGAALLAGSAAVAAATRDKDAWRDPDLAGLLAKAPLVLGDLQTAPQRIDTYRRQLAELVHTGTTVYRRLATLPEPPPEDAIRLLHVSDIHLSPATYPLAQALIAEYRIDAVVDTGDLVDWGTPAENAFTAQIDGLGVPYVFIKGNHDSTGIAAAVAGRANATVLNADDPPVEVAGLRFAGMADPRFTPDKTTGDDHAEHRVSAAGADFAARLRAGGAEVDVLLVHDPAAARALAGLAPLVLAGHTHHRAARREGDTLVLTQGSSGGSGLRGVQADPPTPLALSVLHFERATRRLHSVDEITLGGIGSVSLNVVRRPVGDLG